MLDSPCARGRLRVIVCVGALAVTLVTGYSWSGEQDPSRSQPAAQAHAAHPPEPAAAAAKAAPDALALIGRPGGYVGAAVADGSRALASFDFRVHELDLTNPAQPLLVRSGPSVSGRPALLPGNLARMVRAGDYLYGLVDWDRQQALEPDGQLVLVVLDKWLNLVATLDLPGQTRAWSGWGKALELATLDAGHLLVAETEADGHRLRVVDVSRPAAPRLMGEYSPAGMPIGLAAGTSTAYVLVFDGNAHAWVLETLDVSAPDGPVQTQRLATVDRAMDVAVGGGHAYVAGCGGLAVYSLADPRQPMRVGGLGPLATFAVGHGGGPRQQSTATPVPGPGDGYVFCPDEANVVWRDDVLYASTEKSTGFFDSIGNLWRFDVSRPEQPRHLATTDLAADLERLAVGAGYIVGAGVSGGGGTHVIDLSQPVAPRLGAQLAGDTMISEAIAASPGLVAQLVVLGFDSQLHLIVPGRGIVGRLPLPEGLNRDGGTSAMAIAGDVVYAVPFGRQLMIVDAARPAQPAVLATVPARGDMRAVAAAGDRVVVAEAGTSGAPDAGALRLLDVHDPAAPVEVGRAEGSFGSVAMAGGFIVAGSAAEALVQIFAAEPASGTGSLAPVGALRLEQSARELVAAGGRVYALDAANTLHVLDLSDPTRPRHDGSLASSQGWSPSGAFEHLAARGDAVYAGNRAHQLFTIDAADPSAPRLVATRRLPSPPDLAVSERVLTGGEVAATGWDVHVAGDVTGVWSFGAGTLPERTEPFEGLFWANFEHSRFSPAANGCAPEGNWWELPIGAFPDFERRYRALYPGYGEYPPRGGPGYVWVRFIGRVSPPKPAGYTWWLDRGVSVTEVLDMRAVPTCAYAPPPGTGTPTPVPTDGPAGWRLWLPWLDAPGQ